MTHGIRHDYTGRDGEVRDIPDPMHDDEACQRAVWFHARELYAHLTGRGYPPEVHSPDMAVQAEAAALCAAFAILVDYVNRAIDDEGQLNELSARGEREARAAAQDAQRERADLISDVLDKWADAETRVPPELWEALERYLSDVGPAVVGAMQGHRARQRAAEAEGEARA